jgi:CRISPR-associated protein Cas1
VEGTYLPEPNTAFSIKKESGAERLVENLAFPYLIVQQYLLGLISKPFYRLFEQGSIGFRRGVSRFTAIEMVRQAVADGYCYVIESDIENFFPSVDLRIMEELLDRYIPSGDTVIKEMLKKLLHTGYVLKGELRERTRGLAQGAPLSPLLANLYLDSFDEKLLAGDARMIRYADDFIILTKSREEAEKCLCDTEECLSELGLKINMEKTAIRTIREGIRFLGITFGNSETTVNSEESPQLFKKPLYVSPSLTLSALFSPIFSNNCIKTPMISAMGNWNVKCSAIRSELTIDSGVLM